METKSVTLVSSNGEKLKMVKAIKNHLKMSLSDAKDVADQIPCIITEIPKEMAEDLVNNITSFGGAAYIENPKLTEFVYCGICRFIR